MSTIEAFKVAAAHIRQGVQSQRQDIDNLRRQLDQQKRDLDQYTNNLRDIIRQKQADLARPQDQQLEPTKSRPQKLREVFDLQNQIVQAEHDFARQREQTMSQIQLLERDLINLEQQANAL